MAESNTDCQPGCERPAPHLDKYPCGGPLHVPGSPCQFCQKATPMDGKPCPDCWISLEDLPMADIKGLLALGDLSVGTPEPAAPDG